jgi:hypothetical protein
LTGLIDTELIIIIKMSVKKGLLLLASQQFLSTQGVVVDFSGTSTTKTLLEDGDMTFTVEYYYETVAADDPDNYEYLHFILKLENYDISGWTAGDGHWVGISFGAELMNSNPDTVACVLENYSGTITDDAYACVDMILNGQGSQPVDDATDDLDARLVSPDCEQDAAQAAADTATLIMEFRRKYDTGDATDYAFESQSSLNIMWAFGEYDDGVADSFVEHPAGDFGTASISIGAV